MDWLTRFFLNNWQQKGVAILTAVIIWLFVHSSLTETKTVPNVAIRVVNLPEDKTVVGMMPNGLLSKRIPLTLSGSKWIIDEIEPGDLEVVLDVSQMDEDSQVLKITRKNLVSLNPSLDVSHNINDVQHSEFVLKLSKLMTADIPITIYPPRGQAPEGYIYLDIWPQKMVQKLSGPEEQIEALQAKGFELIFDLSMITSSDLDRIQTSRENFHDDEVSFFLPASWKKIPIPFRNNTLEDINDPEAQNLHIDFLRKEVFEVKPIIPISIYYPLDTAKELNSNTLTLNPKNLKQYYGLNFLPNKLYVKDVSRLFLEVVEDYLKIHVVAMKDKKELTWGLSVITPQELEDQYVSHLMSNNYQGKSSEPRHSSKRENHLRARFRTFLQILELYTSPDQPLHIEPIIQDNQVYIHVQLDNNS